MDVERWWRGAEAASSAGARDPSDALQAAFRHVMRREIDAARDALCAATPEPALAPARELVALRIEAAGATFAELAGVADAMGALAERLSPADPTYPRARHEQAALLLRLARTAAAEAASVDALATLVPDAAARRSWIAQSLAVAYERSGAWHEARRAFAYSLERKARLGDAVGVAITAGSWGRLELSLGRPEPALDLVRRALAATDLPVMTRVRLLTLAVDASLEGGDAPGVVADLEAAIADLDDADYLVGYAALSLARARWAAGADDYGAWFDRAGESLRLPLAQALLAYHRRVAEGPDPATDDAWLQEQQARFDALGDCTQPEVLAKLYVAERRAPSDPEGASRALDALAERVAEANHPLWFDWLDERGRRVDPDGAARRRLRRYLGPQVDRLGATERLDATVVFADLVGFTKRSVSLSTEEVMATVRSVFELASALLQEHRLHPLQYLGDGLLALAVGTDEGRAHGDRALAFARGLTRRMHAVTRARGAMAETETLPPTAQMNVRCGVATGPVVLGPLGNLLRTELLAIGLTTNRAARLQGYAEPDEVVCDEALSPHEGERLEVIPKGFDVAVPARRLGLL